MASFLDNVYQAARQQQQNTINLANPQPRYAQTPRPYSTAATSRVPTTPAITTGGATRPRLVGGDPTRGGVINNRTSAPTGPAPAGAPAPTVTTRDSDARNAADAATREDERYAREEGSFKSFGEYQTRLPGSRSTGGVSSAFKPYNPPMTRVPQSVLLNAARAPNYAGTLNAIRPTYNVALPTSVSNPFMNLTAGRPATQVDPRLVSQALRGIYR